MSGKDLYNPDQAAVDTYWIEPFNEAFRAQRDVGLRVPINFQTIPAVALTPACFANNQYEHNALQKCMSNLLGVGFRRFDVDVYWDTLRSVWSLCPVELVEPGSEASANESIPIFTGSTVMFSTGSMDAGVPGTTLVPQDSLDLKRRQDTSATSLAPPVSSSPPANSSSIAASPTATVVTYPSADGGPPLIQIGNYNCTSLANLDLVTGILADYLDDTSTTTGAAFTVLSFHIHAAASAQNPNGPAPSLTPDLMPAPGALLSDVIRGNLSSDMYTPSRLTGQRTNLNGSWQAVNWDNMPLEGYYAVSEDAEDDTTTSDGWPTETFIEFRELFRMMAGFGSIDPQMESYDISADLDDMFAIGELTSIIDASVSSNGTVTDGCRFATSDTEVTSTRNSSWAISAPPAININGAPGLASPIPSVTNLTACGITALLNHTLANNTADINPLPYAAWVHSTMWSFAPGQPLNATTEDSDDGQNRCAVVSLSEFPGRWVVANCGDRHRVACQDPSKPYAWTVSSSDSTYSKAEEACEKPYQFSVPHTALESRHLLSVIESSGSTSSVFIDVNSLNVPDCWVVGQNGTCPYVPNIDTNRTRIVVVPTVAAVIIFVLAALTFFVKCAANRRDEKRGRRRRILNGWEYEGVPS